MRFYALLLLAALLVASPVAHAADVDEKDVFVLTESNFDEAMAKHKFALVEFYAPWCGHCKNLKPEYAAAATKLKAIEPSVLLSKVDATAEGALATRYGVRGYPTIKWFVDGAEVSSYEAGRSADDIVNWVRKRAGPATHELHGVDAYETLVEEHGEPFVVAKVAAGEAPADLEPVARATDGVGFYTTSDAALLEKLGLAPASKLYAFVRRYEGEPLETATLDSSDLLEQPLAAFVAAQRLPAYLEFSRKNAPLIFGADATTQVIVASTAERLVPGGEVDATLRAAAEKLRGRGVVLVTTRFGSVEAKPLLEYFGLEDDGDEGADAAEAIRPVGYEAKSSLKYRYPESARFTADDLVAFAATVAAGTAERLVKSALPPAEPLENGVRVVVGTTFDEIVRDPTRDVLLEVYAPWCGHCKQLTPIYEKLAKRFATVDSVVIAKMDGTANEHADVQAQGYPTILFFPATPAGAAEAPAPISYEGDRSFADLTKFVKDNAVSEFTLPKKKSKKKAAKKAAAEGEDEARDEL